MSDLSKYAKLQFINKKLNNYRKVLRNIKENLNIHKTEYNHQKVSIPNIPLEINTFILEKMKFEISDKWEEISKIYNLSLYRVFNKWINSEFPYIQESQNRKKSTNNYENTKKIQNQKISDDSKKNENSNIIIKQKPLHNFGKCDGNTLFTNNEIKKYKTGLKLKKCKNDVDDTIIEVKENCEKTINLKFDLHEESGSFNNPNEYYEFLFDENLRDAEIAIIKRLREEETDWITISKILQKPPFILFKGYKKTFFTKSRRWSAEEDKKLLESVKVLGVGNWLEICKAVGRTPQQCLHRYKKISTKSGKWSKDEDERLAIAVEKYKFKWSKVSEFVGSRNDAQCRDRYVNILDPNINRGEFSKEEISRVSKLVRKYGKRWSKIARIFRNRTDSQIRIIYKKYFENYDKKKGDFSV
ncbi:Myb-like protein L [Dictyocoela muelleri]|nr:Myb-like protein L [Dictyocoela muelleri]